MSENIAYYLGVISRLEAQRAQLKRQALIPSPMVKDLRAALAGVRPYVTFVGGRDYDMKAFNAADDAMERILALTSELDDKAKAMRLAARDNENLKAAFFTALIGSPVTPEAL